MPIPSRRRVPVFENNYLIETTDDGSLTLVRRDGELAFHSGCGAASECDHVYLANGGFAGRETHWPQSVLEVGFGTGLAMLRTIDRVIAAHRPLHYVALENDVVSARVLRQLDMGRGLADPALADRFLDRWECLVRDGDGGSASDARHSWIWDVDRLRNVKVVLADARVWLSRASETFDTIYFDPFDPHANPELWTEAVFRDVARCMRPQGRLVTYCVKGEIRRRLATAGFDVRRVEGPVGGKREVLIALK